MPEDAQALADLLPVTYFMRIIRGVFLRDAGLADEWPDALWLIGFAVHGMAAASLRFRKRLD